jgi:hypothetical protein
MGKTLDRPFKDSSGVRGYPYDKYHTDHKKIAQVKKKSIQFEKTNGIIKLLLPDTISTPSTIKITRLNALKLAHWLLDVTQSEK